MREEIEDCPNNQATDDLTPDNCKDKVTPEFDLPLTSLEDRLDWFFREKVVCECDLHEIINTLQSIYYEGQDALNDWPPDCDPVGLTIERLMTLVNGLTRYRIKRDKLGYKHRSRWIKEGR